MTKLEIAFCVVLVIMTLFAISSIINLALEFRKPDGELIVDTSDPEKERWLFKLNKPEERVSGRRMIKLKVTHRKLQEEEKWHDET